MPELPEVETLKLGLQKYVVGKTITGVNVIDPSLVTGNVKDIIGAKVNDVKRYAKGLVLELSNGNVAAFHIKLTGQLIYRDKANKDLEVMKPSPSMVPNKFTRVDIVLDKNSHLYFQEVRRFGWMKILKSSEIKNLPFFKTLGPEPIPSPGSGTPKLKLDMFEKIVLKSNLPIKTLLMDQQKIGGIGNIYANDSLSDAKIDPRRKAKSLSSIEIKTLYDSILKILKKGIKYRGSSELNFVDVLGQMGEYQKHFLVYGRKNKPCSREDGGIVEKVYLGGRGTFYCTKCQK
jgi:formamidopyrimidine-DNA glycosylase